MGKEVLTADKPRDKGGNLKEDAHKDKDKVRDKGKQREKGKDRTREKGKEREKPVPPPPPPREKDKDRSKEKPKEKDVEKEKVKEKDKERRERDKDAEREQVKEKEKEKREKDKDVERERDADKGKDHREKTREKGKAKDTDKESEKERHRDREKAKSKDERPKERDRGRDKDNEKDGEREREREKNREKEKDKERETEREKERAGEKARDVEKAMARDQRVKDAGKESDKVRGREREGKQDEEVRVERAEVPTQELKERIAKSREERLKAQEVQKERKPEKQPEAEDDLSAWINKSRKLEDKKKAEERAKAARMARMLEEQDEGGEDDEEEFFEKRRQYGAKELAGLKVRHGLDKVMEGGAVVLTLKDSSILADGGINEEADELENFEIAQQNAREGAYKAAKKGPGKYEDKFNNDMEGQHEILPKYSDPMLEDGVVLDEKGGVGEEARRRLLEVRDRLAGTASAEGRKESLVGSGLSVAGDYYTQEEMTMFRKPKKERKKKGLRKKEKIDYDAMEAEAIAAGLGSMDRGSRDPGVSRAEIREEQLKTRDAEARKTAYEHALAKATEASRALEEEHMEATMVEAGADVADDVDMDVIGEEEDDELFKALERARQAALRKQADGAAAVAARLAETKKLSEEEQAAEAATAGGLVFTDTGEFCRSLSLDEVAAKKKGGREVEEEALVPPGEEMAISPPESPAASALPSGWMEVGEKVEEPKAVKEEPEEEIEPVLAEKPVGKGLAGVLSMLQSKGELKETVEWGGRNMDKKKSKLVGIRDATSTESWPREIQLERRDEFGRIMTPKQAFRELSHKFHGKFPGKMKQEKRLKQYEEELKMKQMAAGDTPLMAMEKMREEQAKIKSPFILISGHIKPGQTSDPSNGFATVEKSIGSLTPMLGDKKVEYMLGIKRKEGAGNMGPPPAKKPKAEPKLEPQ